MKKGKYTYFTREEIQDVCDLFINSVDKFIIYGLFCGIDDEEKKDLLLLKKDKINFENKTIIITNRIIYMDEYMENVLKDTLDPVFGSRYYNYIDDYELNFDSQYVIKSKPDIKNNNGLDSMKVSELNEKIKILNGHLEDFNIAPENLVISGLMDKMYTIKKSGWTQSEVEEFINQNNIKIQVDDLKREFKIKYE